MTWTNVTELVAAAGPLALVPLAFAAGFAVRIERWHRLVSRLVEAVRDRLAEGERS
jgi:hypothetical protein